MNPFFSIIIPCCNVGKYIRECLESITSQSFENFEVLTIIEDSTDDTEQIIKEFAEKDKRIRVFKQPRSGSGAMPRNTGMNNATGDYLLFCDGDDSIAENSLSMLSEQVSARPGADIYACAIREYMDGGEDIRIIDNYPNDAPVELSGHEAVLILYKLWKKPSPMLQENVWRRDFLNEHNLRCIPGIVYEDTELFERALYLAKRIVPLHVPFYNYRRHPESIMMITHESDYFCKNMAQVLKSLFAFSAKESQRPDFDNRIAACWAREWIDILFFDWFGWQAIKTIPRQKRLETLKFIFEDGFGNVKKLALNTSVARRSLLVPVQLFVVCPILAWPIELFFQKVAFPFALLKNKNKKVACKLHGQ